MHNDFKLYCGDFPGSLKTQCYKGQADCRTSSSLYNKRMMIDRRFDGVMITMSRTTGVIFNTSMVQTKLGKCSYQFDGASFNRLNGGCGCGSPGMANCSDHRSAFYDLDPATYTSGDMSATGGKLCTDESTAVSSCNCENVQDKPTRPEQVQCYWDGVALYKDHKQDQTRKMIAQRIQNEGDAYDLLSAWNEIVVDNHVLNQELERDPAPAIPAMLYVKNPDGNVAATQIAKRTATQMAAECDQGGCHWAILCRRFHGGHLGLRCCDFNPDVICFRTFFRSARSGPHFRSAG